MVHIISTTLNKENFDWCKANHIKWSVALARGISELRNPDDMKTDFLVMQDKIARMGQKLSDLSLENYALRDNLTNKNSDKKETKITGWKSIVEP